MDEPTVKTAIISGIFAVIGYFINQIAPLRRTGAENTAAIAEAAGKAVDAQVDVIEELRTQVTAQVEQTELLTRRINSQEEEIKSLRELCQEQDNKIEDLTNMVNTLSARLKHVALGAKMLADQVKDLGDQPVFIPPPEYYE